MLFLRFELAGSFEGALHDHERVIAYAVGPDGDPLALTVDAADAELPFAYDEPWLTTLEMFPDHPGSPKPRTERTYPASVLCLGESGVRRTVLYDLDTTFPLLQPLPDGEVLLVRNARPRSFDEDDPNGRVYGPDGVLRREFALGDGFEDVQTTADGRIWVSFFDEGIFGTRRGAPGLIRLSPDGTIEWEYEPPPGLDPIADCYALNVATDSVWACYYTEFQLVRIAFDDSILSWRTPVRGAHALAVGEERAAFYGGYGGASSCVLLEFREGELVELESVKPLLPSRNAPLVGPAVIGRGPFLNVFDGPNWFRLDVRATPAQ